MRTPCGDLWHVSLGLLPALFFLPSSAALKACLSGPRGAGAKKRLARVLLGTPSNFLNSDCGWSLRSIDQKYASGFSMMLRKLFNWATSLRTILSGGLQSGRNAPTPCGRFVDLLICQFRQYFQTLLLPSESTVLETVLFLYPRHR